MIGGFAIGWSMVVKLVWRWICGTRDESPSSNLSRGKTGRSNLSRHYESTSRPQRPALDVHSPQVSQRTSVQDLPSPLKGRSHGVEVEGSEAHRKSVFATVGQTDFGQTDFGQKMRGRLWPNRWCLSVSAEKNRAKTKQQKANTNKTDSQGGTNKKVRFFFAVKTSPQAGDVFTKTRLMPV